MEAEDYLAAAVRAEGRIAQLEEERDTAVSDAEEMQQAKEAILERLQKLQSENHELNNKYLQ